MFTIADGSKEGDVASNNRTKQDADGDARKKMQQATIGPSKTQMGMRGRKKRRGNKRNNKGKTNKPTYRRDGFKACIIFKDPM